MVCIHVKSKEQFTPKVHVASKHTCVTVDAYKYINYQGRCTGHTHTYATQMYNVCMYYMYIYADAL